MRRGCCIAFIEMNDDPRLYAIAKRITLEAGFDYTDPRTGETTRARQRRNPFITMPKKRGKKRRKKKMKKSV